MTDRDADLVAVHEAVERLPGWRVTKAEFHEEDRRWHVTAHDDAPRGRLAKRAAISATGATEVEVGAAGSDAGGGLRTSPS